MTSLADDSTTSSEQTTPSRYWLGLALAAWTLLLWTTRVRNALDDVELTGWSRTWQVGISVLFVVVAVVLAVLSLIRAPRAVRAARNLALGLAVFGSAWWAVRAVGIVLRDHPLAFTLVHLALAAGTIGLSWLVIRERGLIQRPGSLVASQRYG